MKLHVIIENHDADKLYELYVSFYLRDGGAVELDPSGTWCTGMGDRIGAEEFWFSVELSHGQKMAPLLCAKYESEIIAEIRRALEERRENAVIERAEARAGL